MARTASPSTLLKGSAGLSLCLLCAMPKRGSDPSPPPSRFNFRVRARGLTPSSRQRHVGRALGQLLAEAALVELGHQRTLQLVALVDEGQPEGEAEIVEDLGVLRPRENRARAHDGGEVAVYEGG